MTKMHDPQAPTTPYTKVTIDSGLVNRLKLDPTSSDFDFDDWLDDMLCYLLGCRLWSSGWMKQKKGWSQEQAWSIRTMLMAVLPPKDFRRIARSRDLEAPFDPVEAFEELRKAYGRKNVEQRGEVIRRLKDIKLTAANRTAFEAFENEVLALRSLAVRCKVNIDDTLLKSTALDALPPSLESLKQGIMSRDIDDDLPLETVLGTIRMACASASKAANENAIALAATPKRAFKKSITCFKCGKKGHKQAECRKGAKEGGTTGHRGAAFFVQAVDNPNPRSGAAADRLATNAGAPSPGGLALMAATSNPEKAAASWIADSGTSDHMTPFESDFETLEAAPIKEVQQADGSTIKSEKAGAVLFERAEGGFKRITGVYFLPELQHALFSIRRITDDGCSVIFRSAKDAAPPLSIFDEDGSVFTHGVKAGGIYHLSSKTVSPDHLFAMALMTTNPSVSVWHARLGHLNAQSLEKLARITSQIDLSAKPKTISCSPCVSGKQTRSTFPARDSFAATAPLQLVHGDLWGPAPTPSLGGARYAFVLVDDFSRLMWVAPLKTKDEALPRFHSWKALVENQSGHMVKIFRSDNGGEFVSKAFKELLASSGILHQTTVPGTPQQNGVAERANRTLHDKERTMRLAAGLPEPLWAEATVTAAYLCNISPRSGVANTPYEAFWGEVPDYTRLQAYGCRAFGAIPASKRGKLDAKGKAKIFVGYGETQKGWKLWDPTTQKVTVECDVRFDETIFPCRVDKVGSLGETNSGGKTDQLIQSENVTTPATPITIRVPLPATTPALQNDITDSASTVHDTPNSSQSNQALVPSSSSGPASNVSASHAPSGRSSTRPRVNLQLMRTRLQEMKASRDARYAEHGGVRTRPTRTRQQEPIIPSECYDLQLQLAATSKSNPRHDKLVQDIEELQARIINDRRIHEETLQKMAEHGEQERLVVIPAITHTENTSETNYAFALNAQLLQGAKSEPRSYKEAISSPDADNWMEAMDKEMNSLISKGVFKLVPKPAHRHPVRCKWVYRIKLSADGTEIERYKARLVACGYTQRQGIDYTETFSPVVRSATIKLLFSLAACHGLTLRHLDVQTAFLNGVLNEEIYMDQPVGFVNKQRPNDVWLLQKSLYGLKQAGRQWHLRLVEELAQLGFERTVSDDSLFVVRKGEKMTAVAVYVDDLLLASNDAPMLQDLTSGLGTRFDLSDLESPTRFLGLQIEDTPTAIHLHQDAYIKQIISHFNFPNLLSRPIPMSSHLKLTKSTDTDPDAFPYKSLIGSIMYAMTGTRPDVAYSLGVLARFMDHAGPEHYNAAKYLLGYLKKNPSTGLSFRKGVNEELIGFCDADYNGDEETMRSTSGYGFTLNGTIISWRSQLQRTASGGGTAESELTAMKEAVSEALWLRLLLEELGYTPQGPTKIFCDNSAAVQIANGKGKHSGVRHYRSRIAFVRDWIELGQVVVLHMPTAQMPADMFTKALARAQLNQHMARFGLSK